MQQREVDFDPRDINRFEIFLRDVAPAANRNGEVYQRLGIPGISDG
jgi:hypothetical protein